jgi:hypothetical protein
MIRAVLSSAGNERAAIGQTLPALGEANGTCALGPVPFGFIEPGDRLEPLETLSQAC